MTKLASQVLLHERAAKPIVIAFFCSGASKSKWRQLEHDLGHRFAVVALDLIGCGATSHWTGPQPFTLSDEAAQAVRIMDTASEPVHLVGHAYGGCVALRSAIERPNRIASMTLYEPVAYHVLRMMGPEGRDALDKMVVVTGGIHRHVVNGDYHGAAKQFFEFWNGKDSWAALSHGAQDGLVRYIPKMYSEFSAAASERVPLHAYGQFHFPILMLQGEFAPRATQMITWQLSKTMRFASLQTIYGAGHMGPFTHAAPVSTMIADWIVRAEPRLPIGERDINPNLDHIA
jgi:pimeloyl-ACP methyl ester carboxylesterase